MVSQLTLAFLGLASTAAATYSPLQLRNLHNLRQERIVVEVRQATSEGPELPTITQSPECISALAPLGSDVPDVPSELLSYMESFAATADTSNPTVLCEATQVPQSLSSQYSSYDQAASSWLSKHSSDLQVAATKCGDSDVQVSQAVASISAFLGEGCGAAASSAGDASSAISTTVSPGLAARPTGMVAGAMAAAGALGVAVLL
ncbi:hypothetical protein F5Y00DRAFT_256671 [Daldinia vernicosa]|uniref:uncharacterized protein n=1 Tax=Daldinia vernicosa TaxID=114800 RepID=UPI0020074ABE|nr:uncharacterized protein F5Y00DRAFT_256671 [Daldinia vernicosa]KAI0854173.1 hypothetical protein F5Y00DRAFT_256671 [Daldinia vernicosa]